MSGVGRRFVMCVLSSHDGKQFENIASADSHALQNCRFHCVYRLDCLKYTMEDYDPIEDEGLELYTDWEGTEREFLDELTYQAVEEGKADYDHSRYPSVELRKAWDIFNLKRFSGPSSACDDCYEEIAELICGCHCDMFDYFVGSRWLCIPCLLVEETMVYKDIQPKAKKGEAPVSHTL